MRHVLIRFLDDRNGTAAIEFGLLALIGGVALIVLMVKIGAALNTVFSSVFAFLG